MKDRFYFYKEETHTVKTKGYIEVDLDFIQVFKSILGCVTELEYGNSLKLLFFLLSEKGDKLGEFTTNDASYKKYCQWLINNKKASISKVTFSEYIKDLFNAGIIIKITKGVYRFNPMYIWEGTSGDRKNLIIELQKDQESKNIN